MRAGAEDRLTLQDCRRLLGPSCTLHDDAILALRDQLYALAAVAVRGYLQVTATDCDANDRADFEERAAILEFDGKLPRRAAERLALNGTRNRRQ